MLCSWVRMALQSVNFVSKTILVKHQEAKAVLFGGGGGREAREDVGVWRLVFGRGRGRCRGVWKGALPEIQYFVGC